MLGNSTSYGLNLLAQGLRLQAGDEVLLVDGDFPASIYPWLPLQRRGVIVKTLPNPSGALEPDVLRAALTERTRVVCTSWVFSCTGRTADVAALVEVCRQHGGHRVRPDGSQAVGARVTDVQELGVDALVSCGFKWLCGPYATGFAWLRPELMQRLNYQQGYWLAQVDEIANPPEHYQLREDLGAAAYDVFCTASLSTFPAWDRAVTLLVEQGLEQVEDYDQALVDQLIDGLPKHWTLTSPRARAERSTLGARQPRHRHRRPETARPGRRRRRRENRQAPPLPARPQHHQRHRPSFGRPTDLATRLECV